MATTVAAINSQNSKRSFIADLRGSVRAAHFIGPRVCAVGRSAATWETLGLRRAPDQGLVMAGHVFAVKKAAMAGIAGASAEA
jgi:hypothetical protein